MAFTEWELEGVEAVNCNCLCGCPCQFNQLPTHGNCCADTFVHVERGRFANVPLDGLSFGFLVAWPGPIHQGNGTFQVVVDERADERQRAALETIAQGREYTTAEVAAGRATSHGAVTLDFADTHAHLAPVHWSPHGVVR
jgi:hypothetical protein